MLFSFLERGKLHSRFFLFLFKQHFQSRFHLVLRPFSFLLFDLVLFYVKTKEDGPKNFNRKKKFVS